MRRLMLSGLILTWLAPMAHAGNANYWFASRNTWQGKRGFYFQLENKAPGDTPPGLETLKLVLGVADGKQWRFIVEPVAWQFDRQYVATAVMGPVSAELWVDGEKLAELDHGAVPHQGVVSTNQPVTWAHDPATYLVTVDHLELSSSGGDKRSFDYPGADRPVGLRLFQQGTGGRVEWTEEPTVTTTITATFKLVQRPPLKDLAPFIDPYGQTVYADWPEKFRSDEDFQSDLVKEDAKWRELPAIEGYDKYGGFTGAGWREPATGFFKLARHGGYWWLITPDGNPCFYLGMNSLPATTWSCTPVTDREHLYAWLPPKEGPFKPFWRGSAWSGLDGAQYGCFYTTNLIRKYGPETWQDQATARAARRVHQLGFNGGGKWGTPARMVTTPVLWHQAVPNLVDHPDVFDPAIRARFKADLERQIEPSRDNPWVLGWSVGNEYDELIRRTETQAVLGKPAATPAKRALLDYAVDELYGSKLADLCAAWGLTASDRNALYATSPKPPAKDLEQLRLHYERAYYEFIYETIKAYDPHHLYLGFWLSIGWWESEDDWRAIAPYCDVIGYDRYADQFADARLEGLFNEARKPVFCGEFSYPPFYQGSRGFGKYSTFVDTESDAGDSYTRWVQDATRNPWCVGGLWFLYRDQELTGRGPGRGPELVYGEHYAFGVVTITDHVKWDLATRMRETNLAAAGWRLEASAK